MKRLYVMRLLGICVCVLFLSVGCSPKVANLSSDATQQTQILQPSSGKALVYYLNEFVYLGKESVSLDEMASRIKQSAYVVWEVEPGEYQLKFQAMLSATLGEIVTADVRCEADQIYYFHMTGSDLDTHEIVRMDDQKGRAIVQRFKAVGWFKDGELVTEENLE